MFYLCCYCCLYSYTFAEFNCNIFDMSKIDSKYTKLIQCAKLYTSNLFLYNIFIHNNKFESNYFTPKTTFKLYKSVNLWYNNRKLAILKIGHISFLI